MSRYSIALAGRPTYFVHGSLRQPRFVRQSRGVARRRVQELLQAGRDGPMAQSACEHLFALDFDGVTCDSVGESSQSAWKAAVDEWPAVFASATEADRTRVLEALRTVRPVVETGYENLLLARLLYERTTTPEAILQGWEPLRDSAMVAYGVPRATLVERFGAVRDAWMAADLPGWLAANALYPGVADSLRECAKSGSPRREAYIVTTKQARFTAAILKELAGLDLPTDRIFSTTVSGEPKSTVLMRLAAAAGSGPALHFVEDKLATLEAVCALPALTTWHLYLVDWGYNTSTERFRAATNARIRVIGRPEFQQLLATGSC